ncbi:MAG: hypothetical protein ACI9G5_002876 [Paracoccaceae bacterium]|jgi:hypothetical protein
MAPKSPIGSLTVSERDLVDAEVPALGFPIAWKLFFKALEGERFGNIAVNDRVDNIRREEGELGQPVRFARMKPLAFNQFL